MPDANGTSDEKYLQEVEKVLTKRLRHDNDYYFSIAFTLVIIEFLALVFIWYGIKSNLGFSAYSLLIVIPALLLTFFIYALAMYLVDRNSLRFISFFKVLNSIEKNKDEFKYELEYSIKNTIFSTEFKINLKNKYMD